jgi:hypothetical protein
VLIAIVDQHRFDSGFAESLGCRPRAIGAGDRVAA